MKSALFCLSASLFVSLYGATDEELIEKKGCFGCHSVSSKKTAPSFAAIGIRNKRFEGKRAKSTIIQSIKSGSQGKYLRFVGEKMPSYPDLTDEELNRVASYILSQSSKVNFQSSGMERGLQR